MKDSQDFINSFPPRSSGQARGPLNASEAESILLNYAGKLLMFQREKSTLGYHQPRSETKAKPVRNLILTSSSFR